MATIMEKDVLLEYVSFGWLVKEKTPESEADLDAMGDLWHQILRTDEKDLDFNAMVQKIRALRSKYEKD